VVLWPDPMALNWRGLHDGAGSPVHDKIVPYKQSAPEGEDSKSDVECVAARSAAVLYRGNLS